MADRTGTGGSPLQTADHVAIGEQSIRSLWDRPPGLAFHMLLACDLFAISWFRGEYDDWPWLGVSIAVLAGFGAAYLVRSITYLRALHRRRASGAPIVFGAAPLMEFVGLTIAAMTTVPEGLRSI